MFGRKLPPTEEERYAADVAARQESKTAARASMAEARAARAEVRAQGATPGRARQARKSRDKHLARRDALLAQEEKAKQEQGRKGRRKGWW